MNSISIVGENAYLYPDFSFSLTKSYNSSMISQYSDLYPLTLYKILLNYVLYEMTGEKIYDEKLPDNFESLDLYISSFLERMIILNVMGGDPEREKEKILALNRKEYTDKEVAFLNYSYMFYLPSKTQEIHIEEDISEVYKLADITQLFFSLKGSYNVSMLKDNADQLKAFYGTLSKPLVPFNGYSCKLTTLKFSQEKYIAISRFDEEFMYNNDPNYKISIYPELPSKQISFSKLLMIYIAFRKMKISQEEYAMEKAFVLYTYDINGTTVTTLKAKPEISFCEIHRDKLIRLENYKLSGSLAASLLKFINMTIIIEKISFYISLITPIISLFRLLRKNKDDSNVER